jgi:ATPase subunit of ABC transporter with duplicated ATPase domains
MLLGQLTPDAGEVTLGAGINMAYLPQNVSFEDEEMTILDYFREDISIPEGKAREHLAKFMFYGPNVFKKIKLLSGGEKVRLKLSKLLYSDINLLILDEPTNHLDTESIESIEDAISSFKGTVLIISHDRYFINKVSNRVIAIEDYAFTSYLGNYDYYRAESEKRKLMNGTSSDSQPVKHMKEQVEAKKKNDAVQNACRKEVSKQKSADKQYEKAEDKQYEKASYKQYNKASDKQNNKASYKSSESQKEKYEAKIHALEDDLKNIDIEMEVNATDYIKLNHLYTQKEELNIRLEALLEEWVSLN